MIYLFVYGTLQRSLQNHHLLKNAKFVGDAKTCEDYVLYCEGLMPKLSTREKKYDVYGEVYSVSEELFDSLCKFEGVGDGDYYVKEIKIDWAGWSIGATNFNLFPDKALCFFNDKKSKYDKKSAYGDYRVFLRYLKVYYNIRDMIMNYLPKCLVDNVLSSWDGF